MQGTAVGRKTTFILTPLMFIKTFIKVQGSLNLLQYTLPAVVAQGVGKPVDWWSTVVSKI